MNYKSTLTCMFILILAGNDTFESSALYPELPAVVYTEKPKIEDFQEDSSQFQTLQVRETLFQQDQDFFNTPQVVKFEQISSLYVLYPSYKTTLGISEQPTVRSTEGSEDCEETTSKHFQIESDQEDSSQSQTLQVQETSFQQDQDLLHTSKSKKTYFQIFLSSCNTLDA